MVAGATGIDVALLVIAADDGVMPQTREHLAILQLLGVDRGAVALTKIDRGCGAPGPGRDRGRCPAGRHAAAGFPCVHLQQHRTRRCWHQRAAYPVARVGGGRRQHAPGRTAQLFRMPVDRARWPATARW